MSRRETRSVLIALVAAGIVAAGLPATASAKGASSFRGHFVGDGRGQSKISLRILRRHGEPRQAEVKARGIPMGCADGTVARVNIGPINVPFVTNRQFYADFETVRDDGTLDIYVIRGEVAKDAKTVAGYVFGFVDRPQPPPEGQTERPDCGTSGQALWRASR